MLYIYGVTVLLHMQLHLYKYFNQPCIVDAVLNQNCTSHERVVQFFFFFFRGGEQILRISFLSSCLLLVDESNGCQQLSFQLSKKVPI